MYFKMRYEELELIKQILAVENNLIIWKLTETNPRKKMEGRAAASSLIFSETISKLYSGVVTGSIHCWDIERA